MKAVILAGGYGSRIAEETSLRPKPMIEIGGKPILWHIMKLYGARGFNHFMIALGYKGEYIKRWMMDFSSVQSNLTLRLADGTIDVHDGFREDWTIDLVDTGLPTMTGGRIKRLGPYLKGGPLMLTYGDGVSDVDLVRLLDFHRSHGKLATMTAVHPPARYGHLEIDEDASGQGGPIREFSEKPQTREGRINGGFYVLEPEVLDYIDADETYFEREPLERLAEEGELMAYTHDSFWQCMDTLRDKLLLEELWESEEPPWKTWKTPPPSGIVSSALR